MNSNDLSNDNLRRFEDEQLDLGSLTNKELNFVVQMAHSLRSLQKEGIVINHYSVTADKFIIILEHTSNLQEEGHEHKGED